MAEMNQERMTVEEVQSFTSVESIKSLALNARYCLMLSDRQIQILRENGAIVNRKFDLKFYSS